MSHNRRITSRSNDRPAESTPDAAGSDGQASGADDGSGETASGAIAAAGSGV